MTVQQYYFGVDLHEDIYKGTIFTKVLLTSETDNHKSIHLE